MFIVASGIEKMSNCAFLVFTWPGGHPGLGFRSRKFYSLKAAESILFSVLVLTSNSIHFFF